jgi:type IV secretion system protein VirB9
MKHIAWAAALLALPAAAQPIREVIYDPMQVIRVPVSRGVPTHVELDPEETIVSELATGLTSVCEVTGSTEAPPGAWYVCGAKGTSDLYVKPIGASQLPNPVAFKTNRRSYSFSFEPGAASRAVQRLIVRAPRPPEPDPAAAMAADRMAAAMALVPKPEEILQSRIDACPQIGNSSYSVATGRGSDDIVPRVVFDDGRFTYFQFAGNAPVPVPFEVLPDGSEVTTNPTMKCGYWSVDRVVRRLSLRHGNAVVSVVNEAFDVDGRPPQAGSTAEGVQRLVRDNRTGQFREPRP